MTYTNARTVSRLIRTASLIDGSATGASVALADCALVGLEMPASMAGTSMTFEVQLDGSTWRPLRDTAGNLVTVTFGTSPSTSGYYSLRSIMTFGALNIRPVSSASETAKTVQFIGQRVV